MVKSLDPTKCPICKSDMILASEFGTAGEKEAHRIVTCGTCFSEWVEIFTLIDIKIRKRRKIKK